MQFFFFFPAQRCFQDRTLTGRQHSFLGDQSIWECCIQIYIYIGIHRHITLIDEHTYLLRLRGATFLLTTRKEMFIWLDTRYSAGDFYFGRLVDYTVQPWHATLCTYIAVCMEVLLTLHLQDGLSALDPEDPMPIPEPPDDPRSFWVKRSGSALLSSSSSSSIHGGFQSKPTTASHIKLHKCQYLYLDQNCRVCRILLQGLHVFCLGKLPSPLFPCFPQPLPPLFSKVLAGWQVGRFGRAGRQ